MLRLGPGTPVTVEGTIEEGTDIDPIELDVENMGWEERALTFMELKNGKLFVDRVLAASPLVAQLL